MVARTRWTSAAVAVAVPFVAFASLALAFYLFSRAVFLNIGYHGDAPPAIRATTGLLTLTSLAYLFAAASVAYGGWRRTSTPFLVAGIVLAAAAILAIQTQAHLRQVSLRSTLPQWSLHLGIVCALLVLAAAWLLHRPSTVIAIATMVVLAAASAAIVLFTVRSNAVREASERVCPPLSSRLVGWIESSLSVPNGHLRAARLQQSTANPSYWFAVAELQGEGFEGDADVAVWLMDAPGASTPLELEYRALRYRTYAVNRLASSVSNMPDISMAAQTLVSLDDCTEEVLREASGW